MRLLTGRYKGYSAKSTEDLRVKSREFGDDVLGKGFYSEKVWNYSHRVIMALAHMFLLLGHSHDITLTLWRYWFHRKKMAVDKSLPHTKKDRVFIKVYEGGDPSYKRLN